MKSKFAPGTLVLVCLLWLCPAGFLPAEELSPAAARMLDDVKRLASDDWEGRGIGTAGLEKAANFIADQFRQAGLNVTAEGGDPFQEFEINDGARLGPDNSLRIFGPDGQDLDLKIDRDFRPCAFGAAGKFEAPVVFLGYGIEAPDLHYNDYENMDVTGKVALILRRNPQQSNPHGPFAVAHGVSRHAALTTKLSQAFAHGAAAVLIVNDPFTGRHEREELQAQLEKARQTLKTLEDKAIGSGTPSSEETKELQQARDHLAQVQQIFDALQTDPLMPFGYGGTRTGKSIPVLQISQVAANRLVEHVLGKDLTQVEAEIDATGKPLSRELPGWIASGTTDVQIVKVPVKNVIGVLEGTGPHAEETIVIGAHFDHLGRGGEGSLAGASTEIHNGADDNASGTAGLLQLARRLGGRKQPLPRRLVFIAFTGEERGLLGSQHYVGSPVFPLDKTIAMFNLDMIGRMEDHKLIVFGTGTSSRWNDLVDVFAARCGLTLSKKPEGFGPSDQAEFYGQHIPVLHLFTGTHSDYHRPSDDWEHINAPGMAQIIDFLELLVLATAGTDERPDYLNVPGMASLERTGSRPYFGSIPEFGKEAEGYALQGVVAGSPAEKAGLKAGDVIIQLNSDRIGGLDDFDLALRKYSAGEQIEVTVLRDGQKIPLKVTLATPK